MAIRAELLQFLSGMPRSHTVGDRQALLSYIGFDDLMREIEWEGSTVKFFNGLLNVLAQRGSRVLLEFIESLQKSDRVGVDGRDRLNCFYADIAALTSEQWNDEFLRRTSANADVSPTNDLSADGVEVNYNTAIIHELLMKAFNAAELRRLCRDNFPQVLPRLNANPSLNDIADQLIEYCEEQQEFEQLFRLIAKQNPKRWTSYKDRVRS